MSVSMGWEPSSKQKPRYFEGGSNLHKILEETFTCFPMTLGGKDLPVLKGIAACGYSGIEEVMQAIYEHGSVVLTAEW